MYNYFKRGLLFLFSVIFMQHPNLKLLKNNSFFIAILLFLSVSLQSCSLNPFKSKEESLEKKDTVESKKRAVYSVREKVNQEQSGIIFGGKDKKDNFGKQNLMWTASLSMLESMPIASTDYQGGVITTDWYSNQNLNESIKISIKFKSNEIALSSVSVKSFKKKCNTNQSCKILPMSDEFNKKVKEQIFEEVKKLNIEKTKNN